MGRDITKNAHYVCSIFQKCPHVSKKAKNAHTSVRGTKLEDILGKTSVTRHDKPNIALDHMSRGHSKDSHLDPLLRSIQQNWRYRPMHTNKCQHAFCIYGDAEPEKRHTAWHVCLQTGYLSSVQVASPLILESNKLSFKDWRLPMNVQPTCSFAVLSFWPRE